MQRTVETARAPGAHDATACMTRDQIVQASKDIERAHLRALQAISRCPSALELLSSRIEQMQTGAFDLRGVSELQPAEARDHARTRVRDGARALRASSDSQAALTALVDLSLSSGATDAVLDQLEAEADPGTLFCRREMRSCARERDRVRSSIVQGNLRLVHVIARQFRSSGLDRADLLQEGTLGLMRAVEKFDYRLGYQFSTYAAWWIRNSIRRAIGDHSVLIHTPRRLVLAARRVRAVEQGQGRAWAIEEVASSSGVEADSLDDAVSATRAPVSLETTVGGTDDLRLGDTLAAQQEEGMHGLDHKWASLRILAAVDQLPAREQEIIRLRFGLGDEREHTLQEIGERLGFSRERARQLETRALEKLGLRARQERLDEAL